VPIFDPSGGRSKACCFIVSIERLRPGAASTAGSHDSTAAVIESNVGAGTS
jgi:hypothetical protein